MSKTVTVVDEPGDRRPRSPMPHEAARLTGRDLQQILVDPNPDVARLVDSMKC